MRRTRKTQWKTKRFPTKQAQSNAEAQRAGMHAENLIEKGALSYLINDVALIRKRHEPYKRVGKVQRGMFKAVNTGSSGCDYEFFLADGRAGILECKSRKGKRINLKDVGEHQSSELQRLYDWEFLAFVIVYLEGVWYLIHWGAFHHVSKKSLNVEDMKIRAIKLDTDKEGCPLWVERIDEALDQEDFYLSTIQKTRDKEQ
jgi:penicillin-binding protein-related factor A (putative recombinase)|tara:strand:- start:1 stop:603 length:603 start_codon:yes stop_codon:yes gene_type:complete